MAISAAEVKKLRDITGAGMMDCKKALKENDGDVDKAIEFLRKKGIASAEKRSGRDANEGVIMSYIHPGSRLGVLVELNCETDFVAKTDDFQTLAKDVAMHVAAANPVSVEREDVDQEVIDREMRLYKEQAQESGKPEAVIEKIIQGKIEKYYSEVTLMEQTFVKNPDVTIKEHIMEVSGKLGENMSVRRFVRFEIGE